MRLALALLASLGLAVAPAAAAPKKAAARVDWLNKVTVTPTGTYVRGNPAAKVKLVEYFSYTCPHCGHFHAEAKAELEAMIRTGRVSFEPRHFMIQPFDLVIPIVARCRGPQSFFAAHDAILGRQAQWEEKLFALPRDPNQSDQAMGAARLIVDSGLGAAAAPGMDVAAIRRCIADPAQQQRIAGMTDAAQALGVNSTPTFFVNGRRSQAATWAELSTELKAAMK